MSKMDLTAVSRTISNNPGNITHAGHVRSQVKVGPNLRTGMLWARDCFKPKYFK